jgi:hypothetical protein
MRGSYAQWERVIFIYYAAIHFVFSDFSISLSLPFYPNRQEFSSSLLCGSCLLSDRQTPIE